MKKYRGVVLNVMVTGAVMIPVSFTPPESTIMYESWLMVIYSARWLRARVAEVFAGARMGIMEKEPVVPPPPVPSAKEVPIAVPHWRFDQSESRLILNSTNRSFTSSMCWISPSLPWAGIPKVR